MSEVLSSAEAYLEKRSNKKRPRSIQEKLARYSDPFISSDGNLCIKLRTYDRVKKIKGINVKTHGIVINLDNKDDVRDLKEYLEDVLNYKDILQKVAKERRDRRESFFAERK